MLDPDARDVAIVTFPLVLVEAVTVNVYAVPLVSPETVIGVDVAVPVIDPGEDIAVYKLLSPGFPRYVGFVNPTVALALPAVAVPIVGALG